MSLAPSRAPPMGCPARYGWVDARVNRFRGRIEDNISAGLKCP